MGRVAPSHYDGLGSGRMTYGRAPLRHTVRAVKSPRTPLDPRAAH
jgi:hypothetical protein